MEIYKSEYLSSFFTASMDVTPSLVTIVSHCIFESVLDNQIEVTLSYNQMNHYDQQQNFLPRKLLEAEDLPSSRSVYSDTLSQKVAVFSAPPILFDIGSRFYEDFLEQMTQSDPQLDKTGFVKTLNKKNDRKEEFPTYSYRKFSLQTEEEYRSYYNVNVPTSQFYASLSPQEEIMNSLQQAAQWARDQYGSRTVQSIIENGESYAKNAVFEALIQESIQLTKDKFGNYVFQKIFQRGQREHKERLFAIIKDHILQFSQNCYGCRVVQKAIEFAAERKELQAVVIKLIEPYSLYLIQNINGNHVMQKCFEVIDLAHMQKIVKVILENYRKLCVHAYGCRVIQKYLEKLHAEIITREQILTNNLGQKEFETIKGQLASVKKQEKTIFDKLMAISVELSQCQYGNYVMQHIVTHSKDYKQVIEDNFLNNFVALSCNKYASNVIQKVIKLGSAEYREKLAKKLYECQTLVSLAKHQFGNYVIQCLMQKISMASRTLLKMRFKQFSQEISKSQYGRHVLLQIEKIK